MKKPTIRFVTHYGVVGVGTVLHEVAHAVVGPYVHCSEHNPHKDSAVHGPFVRTFLAEMVVTHFGVPIAYARAVAASNGVPLLDGSSGLVPKPVALYDISDGPVRVRTAYDTYPRYADMS